LTFKMVKSPSFEKLRQSKFIAVQRRTTMDPKTSNRRTQQVIPAELRDLKRWVVWRYETREDKPTKVLYNPLTGKCADSTDEATWVDFSTAVDHAGEYEGIGCVIGPPFAAIDLDKCRDPQTGKTEEWAQRIIMQLDSYTEVSPSGRGYHIWVKAKLPPTGRRAGRVEMYDSARYFTMTGGVVKAVSAQIEERDLTSLHSRLATLDPEHKKGDPVPTAPSSGVSPPQTKLGPKFDLLMAGRWKEAGYASQSEGDLALCMLLSKKVGCDPAKIDVAFRKSRLMRDKWNRADYRNNTITAAIDVVKNSPPIAKTNWKGATPAMDCATDIETKPVVWLWENRIPKGMLTYLTGNPDVGKSVVTCDLVARYTRELNWPDGAENAITPGEVLMFIAEDDLARTVVPRLEAAGADLSRIRFPKKVQLQPGATKDEREFAFDADMQVLARTLRDNPNIGLVVVDPITSYLGKVDMNKEQDVRRVLTPLRDMCEETGVTCISVGHFNKRCDVAALHKSAGAVAMVGVPRALWFFLKNPAVDGEYLMLSGKGNLRKKCTGLRYRIGVKILPGLGELPLIMWQGEAIESDADQVLETTNSPDAKGRAKARHVLEQCLADGARPAGEVITAARTQGVPERTLFRAKDEIGIISTPREGRRWWALPHDPGGARMEQGGVPDAF
jgi:hypothetical protein